MSTCQGACVLSARASFRDLHQLSTAASAPAAVCLSTFLCASSLQPAPILMGGLACSRWCPLRAGATTSLCLCWPVLHPLVVCPQSARPSSAPRNSAACQLFSARHRPAPASCPPLQPARRHTHTRASAPEYSPPNTRFPLKPYAAHILARMAAPHPPVSIARLCAASVETVYQASLSPQ